MTKLITFSMHCYLLLQHNSCAIHVASQGKKDIVEMLLSAGCNINAVDDVSYIIHCQSFSFTKHSD